LTATVDCANAAIPYMVSVGSAMTLPSFRDWTASLTSGSDEPVSDRISQTNIYKA